MQMQENGYYMLQDHLDILDYISTYVPAAVDRKITAMLSIGRIFTAIVIVVYSLVTQRGIPKREFTNCCSFSYEKLKK